MSFWPYCYKFLVEFKIKPSKICDKGHEAILLRMPKIMAKLMNRAERKIKQKQHKRLTC